jgi:hypothetical protein
MQEDVAGTLRTIGHDTRICSLCGTPYPANRLTPMESALDDGVRSEREDVCPDCARSLASGDNPAAPINLDEQTNAAG